MLERVCHVNCVYFLDGLGTSVDLAGFFAAGLDGGEDCAGLLGGLRGGLLGPTASNIPPHTVFVEVIALFLIMITPVLYREQPLDHHFCEYLLSITYFNKTGNHFIR